MMSAQSIEIATSSIIADVLADPSLIQSIDLMPDDFGSQDQAILWQELQTMISERVPIEPITLAERLKKKTGREWVQWLIEMKRSAIGHHPSHVKLIKKTSITRKALDVVKAFEHAIAQEEPDAIEKAVKGLMSLTAQSTSFEQDMISCIQSAIEGLEARKNGAPVPGVSCGIPALNRVVGHFRAGMLTVIGARPAMGKTALMLNLTANISDPVGVFSGEQDALQIGERMISILAGVDNARTRKATLTDLDYASIARALSKQQKRVYRIDTTPNIHLSQLISQTRKWVYHYGIKAVYVDYLQNVVAPGEDVQRVGLISRQLKGLARELDIAVIALAQVKRDVEGRIDKRPLQGDLSDSSQIEKDADMIITLYRDEVYDSSSPDAGIAELLICKNRHGPTGKIKTRFKAQALQFLDLETRHD